MKTFDAVHELFLNYACPAKCSFCYNPPITPELLRRELSYEQAAASLYKASQDCCARLNLHGGEVTLRDDLPKILRLARKLKFTQITLVTNGVRLGVAAYARSLKAAGLTHVRLSIHAPDAAAHDAILQIPGAFDRATAALGHLKKLKVPVGLNFVLHRPNYKLLPAFLDHFCVRGGVRDVIVYFPHLKGMMEINAAEAGVSYSEVMPVVRASFGLLSRAGLSDSLLLANFVPCLLPEFSERMLDWARDGGASQQQVHPEGFREDIHEMKDGQRAPVKACKSCSLRATCMGVETEYRKRRGEAEFKALESQAA